MATVTGTRSRTTQQLAQTVEELTDQIRALNEDAGELSERRRVALAALVKRHGYAETARMVGMSRPRVQQIVDKGA